MMKFKKIYIELSDICGLNCPFCPTKKEVRDKMSVSNFKTLTKQIKNKAKLFTFHVLGDPLILDNIQAYLDIALQNNMLLELTTSGFYMSEKNQNLLLNYKNIRQINISLMAFLTQDKISCNEYFDKIFKLCIKHLQAQNKSFINLRLWNLTSNFEHKNALIYDLLENFFKIKIDKSLDKNRLARHIILHQQSLFKWPNSKHKAKNLEFSCHALNFQIAILSNGSLVPCCMDTKAEICFGNVFKQDFDTLLKSPRLKAMKEAFKENKRIEKLCTTCEFYKAR